MPRAAVVLFIIVGFAIFIGALFAVVKTWPPLAGEEIASEQTPAQPVLPSVEKIDPIRGSSLAPVTIIEYSDFECLSCADAAQSTKQLLDKYPEKVRLVWKDMPNTHVHFKALQAHIAARCAFEQGKFWEYHDLLFARQLELAPERYLPWATELGLDSEKFQSCLASQRGREIVQTNRIEGERAGVDATPYYFIGNERRSGVVSLEEFEDLVP